MKIVVNLEVSESETTMTFDLEDLNLTQEQWELMNEDERTERIQEAVDDRPHQPSWCVDTFKIR